jgi:hypothetical protein
LWEPIPTIPTHETQSLSQLAERQKKEADYNKFNNDMAEGEGEWE